MSCVNGVVGAAVYMGNAKSKPLVSVRDYFWCYRITGDTLGL